MGRKINRVVQSTTARILKKRARKKELRRQYLLKITEEAKKLGITVAKLLQTKALEGDKIRRESAKRFIITGRGGGTSGSKNMNQPSHLFE